MQNSGTGGAPRGHEPPLKITRPVEKSTIWSTFGPKFSVFTLVKGHLRPRAAGFPIGHMWLLLASRTSQDKSNCWFRAKNSAKSPKLSTFRKVGFWYSMQIRQCVAEVPPFTTYTIRNLSPRYPPSQVVDNRPHIGG
jgi:hypothetical protein